MILKLFVLQDTFYPFIPVAFLFQPYIIIFQVLLESNDFVLNTYCTGRNFKDVLMKKSKITF